MAVQTTVKTISATTGKRQKKTKTNGNRIRINKRQQTVQLDLSELTFETAAQVNRFYDLLEKRLTARREKKWYFLVNLKNLHLCMDSWIAFAIRGKRVNDIWSWATVHYGPHISLHQAIASQLGCTGAEPILFPTRPQALSFLTKLKNKIARETARNIKHLNADKLDGIARTIGSRFEFIRELDIVTVDFRHFTFDTPATVDEFFDVLTIHLQSTGQKWYFVVKYSDTRVYPEAWYQWAKRSRALFEDYSLGAVRICPPSDSNMPSDHNQADMDTGLVIAGSTEQAIDQICKTRTRPQDIHP